MADRHDIVLGGGLAGLTAAYTLQQAGLCDWIVLEKEHRPGGHARSVQIDGYVFDYGPHILFTNDPGMEELIRDLLGANLRSQERQAFIYHAAYDTFTRFPFQAHLYGLPVDIVRDCLLGLVDALRHQGGDASRPRNYEEWMRGTFGDAIADHLMIPYARKLWTVEPSTMDFDWIDRRVPTPDFERILTGALTADVSQVGATAQFWYPWRGGIEALPTALADRVANIQLRREVERIDVRRRTLDFADGETLAFRELVFTLPLAFLPRWIPDLPPAVESACARLQFQGILNVNLGIDRAGLSEYHWIYFHEDPFPFHRLSFPANFSPHNVPPGKSSISTEIAYRPGEQPDLDTAVSASIDALRAARILAADDVVELVHVEAIAPAYVIYDLGHASDVEIIASWLRSAGIRIAGRFGEWQYLNMDHAMKGGRDVAAAIIAERAGVNSAV